MDKQSGAFSFPHRVDWWGVVEDRVGDPMQLGRVRVRIYGYYTGDPGKMPTEDLPWAIVIQDPRSAALSGIGYSPTGMLEGTTVCGVFLDGDNAQVPAVTGTLAGMASAQGFEGGFKDPNGKYPREPGSNDVNKLARGDTGGTVIERRNQQLQTAEVAFGGQWQEPASKYAAKYPYNHVYESERGHVTEFDDTEGRERMSGTHRTGTFWEIDPEGNKVEKVVKDHYSLTMGNDFVRVQGNVKVYVVGNSSVLINGNADIEVNGNCREHIHGSYRLEVDGNYDVEVHGHHYQESDVHFKAVAPRIDLNP